MAVEYDFSGGAKAFHELARRLERAADADVLTRAIQRGIDESAPPLIAAARAEARELLPKSGGLAAAVAASPIRTQVTARARRAGVRIVVEPGAVKNPRRIDRGAVRHPTFGHDPQVVQRLRRGWFSGSMRKGAPAVRDRIVQAVNEALGRI